MGMKKTPKIKRAYPRRMGTGLKFHGWGNTDSPSVFGLDEESETPAKGGKKVR